MRWCDLDLLCGGRRTFHDASGLRRAHHKAAVGACVLHHGVQTRVSRLTGLYPHGHVSGLEVEGLLDATVAWNHGAC